MQTRSWPLILSFLFTPGCKEEPTIVKDFGTTTYNISPQSYSTSYYFVDTLYRKYWEPMHKGISFDVTPDMQDNMIIQLDLWMSTPQSIIGKIVKARAYTDIPARLSAQKYSDSLEQSIGASPGQKYIGHFFKLVEGSDYRFKFDNGRQMLGGYVVLNITIPEDQALAVTYTVFGGGNPRAYGTLNGSTHDTTADGYFLFKLIRPPGLTSNPGYHPAWELQLRNVYRLVYPFREPRNRKVQIVYSMQSNLAADAINGEPLLRAVGLDRFDANYAPNPDGEFDFIPGLTVDLERADLIFPTLRPFDSTIAKYFLDAGKPLTDDDAGMYLDSAVYDTTSSAAQNHIVNNRYFIRIIEGGPSQ